MFSSSVILYYPEKRSNGTRPELKRIDLNLPLWILLFAGSGAQAQEDPHERARNVADGELLTCRASSASRTRPACGEAEEKVLRAESEITLRVNVNRPDTPRCSAWSEIEYTQRDTVARVAGKIEHEHCAASHGQYTMNANVVDEHGESKRLQFDEFWQRLDDRPVTFSSEYPMGDNIELVRMWISSLRCTCGEAPEAAPAP